MWDVKIVGVLDKWFLEQRRKEMVAAEADKWRWDLYKRVKFKIKDIQTFEVHKSEFKNGDEDYTIVGELESGQRVILDRFEYEERCQKWIDQFIKENL